MNQRVEFKSFDYIYERVQAQAKKVVLKHHIIIESEKSEMINTTFIEFVMKFAEKIKFMAGGQN